MAADPPLIVAVVGTRPEAIKMAPVLRALAKRESLALEVIVTGQHPRLRHGLDWLPIRNLAINPIEQSPGEVAETIRDALCKYLLRRRPALVLVQGDTTSALAGALAASDCEIPVGHIEAGLRSGDLMQPWPEEANRIAIDQISDLLFVPSEAAADNLLAEPAVTGETVLTGNSGIDALFAARERQRGNAIGASERKLLLVTCHRRENQGEALLGIAAALARIVRELPIEIMLPLHANPKARRPLKRLLVGEPHINLLDPLEHEAMVGLIERSWAILTDSGGLQEEGPALGKPVLVLRNVTERGEGVASANIELVGTEPSRIFAAVASLLWDEAKYRRMATPSLPFGDGHASPRIADAIEQFLKVGPVQRSARHNLAAQSEPAG